VKYIGYAAALWFGVTGIYVLVMHAKSLRETGGLSTFWMVNILPWAVVGLLLDVAFNVTFGTLMFRELPRELLFTSRVQRHYMTDGSRGRMAAFWARQLNQIDATHIHEPHP
jgi:hypothetical protein